MDTADEFFEVLGRHGEDAALSVLTQASFGDGQEPSPRARELINIGEWDAKKKLRLLPVSKDKTCWGILAPVSAVGADIGPTYTRFCYKDKCLIASHAHKVPDAQQRDGWYLEATGSPRGGACLDISFPYEKPPGPIDGDAAARLVGPQPFSMSFGQWRFIYGEYLDHRIQSMSSDSQDETEDTSGPAASLPDLQVDTNGLDTTVPPDDTTPTPMAVNPTDTTTPERVGEEGCEEQDAQYIQRLVNREVAAGVNKIKTDLEGNLQSVLQEAKIHTDLLHDQLRQSATRNKNLQKQVDQLVRDRRALPDVTNQYRNLVSRIEFLEGTQSVGVTDTQQDLLQRLEFEVFDTHGSSSRLRATVQGLKNKLLGGGELTCHGISFGSMHEAVLWCKENNLKPSHIADAKALVQCIQPTVTTQDQATKTMEAQRKVEIDTDLEAAIITSFKGVVPPALVGGKIDTEGGAYEVLSAYQKNFPTWDPPGTGKGLKSRLIKGVKAAIGRMETLQRSACLGGEAYTLASGCIQDSNRFLMELANWKTNSYRELTEDTTIPKDIVWAMLLECEAKIWEDIDEVRAVYVDSARFESGYYIWAMLKAREVQERYLTNNIQDDPALTGIFTRHILFHGEDMSIKSKLQALTEQLTKTEAATKTNAGEIRSNGKKIKDLEKDVKRLQ